MEKMNSQNFRLKKKNNEIIETLITNVVKMMTERKLLNENDIEENINKLKKSRVDNTFTIKVNNKEYIINIIRESITSISMNSSIINFINKNKNKNIFLIIKDITETNRIKIEKMFNNVQIFYEYEMMINIIDCNLIPKHIKLTEKEIENVLMNYNCKKKNLQRIFVNDPVARYYGLKIGDVCKIIRPSLTTVQNIAYRVVVDGNVRRK